MRIVTDSAVDLPEEMFAQFNIERLPLLISFGKEMLRSGIDIGPDEFYRRLAACGDNLPTTSQPSPGDFADLYRKVGATDRDDDEHAEQERDGSDQPEREMLLRFEEPNNESDEGDRQRDIDSVPARQRDRLAMGRQRPAGRIDMKRGDVVLGPGGAVTRSAAARCNIQIAPRHMRPRILHARGQRHALARSQRASFDIDLVTRECRIHVCI